MSLPGSASPRARRVLRVVTRLNIGGPAQHAIWLNAGLERLGYETWLVSGQVDPGEGEMLDLVRQQGLRHVVIPALTREVNPLRDLAALLALWWLMRSARPDIVHTHMAKAGALGRLAAAGLRVPTIIHTFHGHIFTGYFPKWKTACFLAVERLLARVTHVLVAISPSQKADLVSRYRVAPEERVRVIPLGIPLAGLQAGAPSGTFRRALEIPAGRLLIGCVGRLVPIKNTGLQLDAVARLNTQNGVVPFHWVIVGDGPERRALEERARALGVSDRVTFAGWWRDLASLYADLDVVVLTSHNEGTPVALIEAMAAAKPVVATAVGGVVDLLQQGVTGLLVPPGDVEALARAVTRLTEDPDLRAQLGRAGQRWVLERYLVERLVKDMDELYRASPMKIWT